jgi:Bardet-Biedl syndrome 4 protein
MLIGTKLFSVNFTLVLFIRWYPDSSELATSLGLLYMTTGQHQRAFEKLGSALAHDSLCTKALLAAGSVMQVW